MVDFGMKVSQTGRNVNDVKKFLSFTSAHQHLMVLNKGVANATNFEYTHGLGYAPAFDGYYKEGRKYFLNYMAAVSAYGFENPNSGRMYVDETKLYADCASANKLAYICYLNPIIPAAGNKLDSIDTVGLKFSKEGVNVLDMKAGETHLNTAYQCPLIVDSGTATVVVDSIYSDGAVVEKTNFTDVSHGQPEARQVICPDFYEKVGTGGFASVVFYPAPIGFIAPFVTEDYEVYVDDDKIRFRVSRTAEGVDPFTPAEAPVKTVDFRWHITNIILPS